MVSRPPKLVATPALSTTSSPLERVMFPVLVLVTRALLRVRALAVLVRLMLPGRLRAVFTVKPLPALTVKLLVTLEVGPCTLLVPLPVQPAAMADDVRMMIWPDVPKV